MKFKSIMVLAAIIFCACTSQKKNVSLDEVKEQIVDGITIDNPLIIDLKENKTAGERYGISTAKIEDGFVYTNNESVEKSDEIIVIKATNKKTVKELEIALEREITNLSNAWDGVDESEYKKIQKHKLKSNGNYLLLAVCDKSKEAEKIFDTFFA